MKASLYQIIDPERELDKLGCSGRDRALMLLKSRHYSLKLRRVSIQAALILKQEALARGAAVAMPRDAVLGHQADHVDLLLMGTEKQLEILCSRLTRHPHGLAEGAEAILEIVRRASRQRPEELHLGRHRLPLGKRTLIMGILNVTPDSFSDGGKYDRVEEAVARARKMEEEGADIIDIGGESTRPGSQPVGVGEELSRVMPVIKALKSDHEFSVPLSIDTSKARVAREALQAGVEMINDVWGLKKDPVLAGVAAGFDVTVCLMHNRLDTVYEDLIADIFSELQESIALARAAGIKEEKIIIDPGIGFGKDLQQNLDVMRHLRDFRGLGYPLLLGTSRKSMIGKTLDLPVDDRLEGTAATMACGIAAGADLVRVHDVREMCRVARMTDAIIRR